MATKSTPARQWRGFLAFLLVLSIRLVSATALLSRQAVQTYDCKPGQACWPTTAQWAAFNTTVGGRLVKTVPFAAPCFLGNPAYNFGQCSAIQQSYTSASARANNYGNAQAIQYEACGNAECQLVSLAPGIPPLFQQCSLGRLAAYYVDATSASDVSATLAFVRQHNIRLSIKNTGHDYLGRSMAPNSLALWTHNIQSLKFFPTFTPQNCASNGAFQGIGEIGAGTLASQAIDFFGARNVDITVGNAGTVGVAGGFGQTAGHGVFGPSYGLMVDQAVEFDVVTAAGEFKTINACNDPDLFWAMRGGGGGTYAVLVAYRFKTYPRKSIHTYHFQASFSLIGEGIFNRPVLRALINAHISNSSQFSANKVTGRFYYGVNLVDFLVTLPSNDGDAQLRSLTAAFRAGITTIPGITVDKDLYTSYATYSDYNVFAQEGAESLTPTGYAANVASRLIPHSFFTPDDTTQQTRLADAILQGIETASGIISVIRGMPVLLVLMTTPANTPDTSRQTSAQPAWRDALWHATYLGGWIKGFPISSQQEVINTVYNAAAPLRALTPGGGSYFNEDSILIEDWQTTFFGGNYERLLQIKNRYDPTHLFDCWKCVGWRGTQDPGYSCYGPNPTGATIPV